MAEIQSNGQRSIGVLAAVSTAMVSLHKEQFGRGPRRARTNFAGADVLVCVLEDALLPAERTMVLKGDQQRVRESRAAFQAATRDQFVGAVEAIVRRRVVAFASAVDADAGVVWEIYNFESAGARGDGARP
jgi:uncharacterized protein YbcI